MNTKIIYVKRFLFIAIISNCLSIVVNAQSCTLDVAAENNISVTVDYVRLASSIETRTFSSIPSNDYDAAVFQYVTSEGFGLSVKMPSYPGTGSIRITNGITELECISFINSSSSLTYHAINDFSGVCHGGIFIFIETSSCN